MKAFLILEDGHVFKGTSIGSTREVISEIVFNTSMTGYLEVMTDPSYAGQAVCMTYPLIEITESVMRTRNPGNLGSMVLLFVNYPVSQVTSEVWIRSSISLKSMIYRVLQVLTLVLSPKFFVKKVP